MLLVASLFSVKDRNARDFFVRTIRRGGSWQTAACRIAPELIELDIFEHMEDAPKAVYLCLDLWKTAEAYHSACCSAEVQNLLLARRLLADSSFELGAFAFTAAEDPDDKSRSCAN
jgi:hypothetical protein